MKIWNLIIFELTKVTRHSKSLWPAQNQSKSQILFHKNCSPLDLYSVTLTLLRPPLQITRVSGIVTQKSKKNKCYWLSFQRWIRICCLPEESFQNGRQINYHIFNLGTQSIIWQGSYGEWKGTISHESRKTSFFYITYLGKK